jgi:hypothetical protein
MKIENNCFRSLYNLLFQLLNRKSMFVVLHSDITPLKSVLPHLAGQLRGRVAKVKDGISN